MATADSEVNPAAAVTNEKVLLERPSAAKPTRLALWKAVYNAVSIGLWVWVLYGVWTSRRSETIFSSSGDNVWRQHLHTPLYLAQSAALLDIIHAATGIVQTSVFTTCAQVLSRLHVVWLVFRLSPASHGQSGWLLLLCATAWAFAEIIRYGYYLSLQMPARSRPQLLLLLRRCLHNLRYSVFLVLYPVGILGEVMAILAALPTYAKHYTRWPYPMPNRFNFELNLHVCYCFILCLYIPGSVWLYSYMLARRRAQRRKSAD